MQNSGVFSDKVKKKNMEDLMKKNSSGKRNLSMVVRRNDMKMPAVISHLEYMSK